MKKIIVVLVAIVTVACHSPLSSGMNSSREAELYFPQLSAQSTRSSVVVPSLKSQTQALRIVLTKDGKTTHVTRTKADIEAGNGKIAISEVDPGTYNLLVEALNAAGGVIMSSDHSPLSLIVGGTPDGPLTVLLKGKMTPGAIGRITLKAQWPGSFITQVAYGVYSTPTVAAVPEVTTTAASLEKTDEVPTGTYLVTLRFTSTTTASQPLPQNTSVERLVEVWDNGETVVELNLTEEMFAAPPKTPGAPPQGVKAVKSFFDSGEYPQMQLVWTGSSGDLNYRIERKMQGEPDFSEVSLSTSSDEFLGSILHIANDPGVSSGLSYTYRIIALNPLGESVPLVLPSITAAKRLWVRTTPSGTADGSSWGDALGNLNTAYSLLEEGDQLIIGEGSYSITSPLVLKPGVTVAGSRYSDTISSYNPASNPTVITTAAGFPAEPLLSYVSSIPVYDQEVTIQGLKLVGHMGSNWGSSGSTVKISGQVQVDLTDLRIVAPAIPGNTSFEAIGLDAQDADLELESNYDPQLYRGGVEPQTSYGVKSYIGYKFTNLSRLVMEHQDVVGSDNATDLRKSTLMALENPQDLRMYENTFTLSNLNAVDVAGDRNQGVVIFRTGAEDEPFERIFMIEGNKFTQPEVSGIIKAVLLGVYAQGFWTNDWKVDLFRNRFYTLQGLAGAYTQQLELVGDLRPRVESSIFYTINNSFEAGVAANVGLLISGTTNPEVSNNLFMNQPATLGLFFSGSSPVVRNNIFEKGNGVINTQDSFRPAKYQHNLHSGGATLYLAGATVVTAELNLEAKTTGTADPTDATGNIAFNLGYDEDNMDYQIIYPKKNNRFALSGAGISYREFDGIYPNYLDPPSGVEIKLRDSPFAIGPWEFDLSSEISMNSEAYGRVSYWQFDGDLVEAEAGWGTYTPFGTAPSLGRSQYTAPEKAARFFGSGNVGFKTGDWTGGVAPDVGTAAGFSVAFLVGRLPANTALYPSNPAWLVGKPGVWGVRYIYNSHTVQVVRGPNDGESAGEVVGTWIDTGKVLTHPWNHLTLVWDNQGDQIKLFLNGAEVLTADYGMSSGPDSLDVNPGNIGLSLGLRSGADTWQFRGHLDELMYYNRPLTDSEVGYLTALNNQQFPVFPAASSLVAEWLFDPFVDGGTAKLKNTASTTLTDLTEPVAPSLTSNPSGEAGQAVSFNGTSQYLSLSGLDGANYNLSIYSSDTWTFSFWIKSNGTFQAIERILTWYSGSGTPGISLYLASGTLGIGYDDGSSTPFATTGNLNPSENTWYHIAVTMDRSDTNAVKLDFYVNGSSVNYPAIELSGPEVSISLQTLQIGYNEGLSQYLKGYLDDVRIHNKILTQAEIYGMYWEGLPTTQP